VADDQTPSTLDPEKLPIWCQHAQYANQRIHQHVHSTRGSEYPKRGDPKTQTIDGGNHRRPALRSEDQCRSWTVQRSSTQ
jgi:hypothetical protein